MLPFSSKTRVGPEKEAPATRPGLRFAMGAYDFGLQALAVASHMPPALWQSALVLAVVTSAARVGAVKATARPRATIADTSFFITTSPPFVRLPVGIALSH